MWVQRRLSSTIISSRPKKPALCQAWPLGTFLGLWSKRSRDDDVKWNADLSLATLSQLWPRSQEALEDELRVGDAQSRSDMPAGFCDGNLNVISLLTHENRGSCEMIVASDSMCMTGCGTLGLAEYLRKLVSVARPYVLREITHGDFVSPVRSRLLLRVFRVIPSCRANC